MRILFAAFAATLTFPAFAQVQSTAASPAVVVKALSDVALFPQREASAQAVSLNESRVAAEIAGRIEAIGVKVGEQVRRGAVLARIDCRDHELARERAEAAVGAARARLSQGQQQLDRARSLAARGFYSKEALASRETDAQVLRADSEQANVQLATAKREVEKCTVRSPFTAIVRERLGQVGELAAPGTPLIALSDAGHVEVSAQVQLKDAESLKSSSELRFVADGGTKMLALLRISPAVTPQARTREARLRFKGKPAAAGVSGALIWRESRPHVPAALVVRRQGRLGIFIDERGVARFHALAEAQEGRPAMVDLAPETRIVVAGQLALRDGQPIATVKK